MSPDVVHEQPLPLEEVHAVPALFHGAVMRVPLRVEGALQFVAFEAGAAPEALFVETLPCRCDTIHELLPHPCAIPRT
jgi:hypothetical protein